MKYFEGFRVTSPYGPRRNSATGAADFHTGVDLAKAHRAPIPATVPGKVLFAGEGTPGSGFGGFGITAAVQDKYGALHCYCHLDSVSVAAGQSVQKGQEVGKQGSTGQASGSHLHYEIRKTAHPNFGWMADRANNCYEPEQYLDEYFAREAPRQPGKTGFRDVPDDHWAAASIAKAAAADVIKGVAPEVYGLGQPVTREQLAVILDRLGLLDKR
ncbi:M23 family peptidase [Xylanibacillus composti]|uniref:SLH domain-containing protein n=1 Tax=Xylanibacillus composti TaxID=1572762 RepID=A0A8J4H460_9BACL|nr:M23 family metallopeptidase [Xylanibacillus composti]MDT9724314.1 M23 family peptidase [Xylanibacillus composti]GIQ69310.1 hypothetical protein XYCOK13_21340 [Xylanibacillus composti]